jgi:ribosomal 30S subunit maturation factor RimM
MTTGRNWHESIRIGFQVFAQGGTEEFGAVRDVCPGGRTELLVNIENGGDHCIPVSAIVDVHDEKVIVDPKLLPAEVRRAIPHAHDAEVPGL